MSKLLTADEIAQSAAPLSDIRLICGVYFLIDADEIVYVGQSIDVRGRILTHAKSGVRFDRWAHVPCDRDALDRLERTYIDAFNPARNRDPLTRRSRGECKAPSAHRVRYKGTHIYTPDKVFSSATLAAKAHDITRQLAHERALRGWSCWKYFTPDDPLSEP